MWSKALREEWKRGGVGPRRMPLAFSVKEFVAGKRRWMCSVQGLVETGWTVSGWNKAQG